MNTKNKYKVEITKTFCVDVIATNEEEAKEFASVELWNAQVEDKSHYLETGNDDICVYDVTKTDDPFNPINE